MKWFVNLRPVSWIRNLIPKIELKQPNMLGAAIFDVAISDKF